MKEINDNLYLSKLIVNEITKNSIYVCVSINYYGFSFRENFVNIELASEEEPSELAPEAEAIVELPEKKNYELLFLIPIVLLMPISVLICTIFYLLINRQILKRNKNVEA